MLDSESLRKEMVVVANKIRREENKLKQKLSPQKSKAVKNRLSALYKELRSIEADYGLEE